MESAQVISLQNLITAIAKTMVDYPEKVEVEVVSDLTGVTLRLTAASSDLGKLIGKQGRTAQSMRTIVAAASMKHKRRFTLDIHASDTGARSTN
jgi:predicted RNA-binding protein YlqC (UPF0109 family)